MKRNHIIKIRVSKEEKIRIVKKAKITKLTTSEYLRELAINSQIVID